MRAVTLAAAAVTALVLAPAVGAGILVKNGTLALDVRQNGSPVPDRDVEVVIRTREEIPPRVILQGHNPKNLDLPEGHYDATVRHNHLLMHPLKFHFFEVRGGTTTRLASDVRTFELLVHPRAGKASAWNRVSQMVIENTNTGEKLRFPTAGPVILPEGQYKVRMVAKDLAGAKVERERTLYLACDTTVDFDI